MINRVILFLLAFALLSACNKGELINNIPPTTKIFVSSIELSGEDRLNSNVKLSWSGTDADGYVIGYEISLDNKEWFYTEKQDSTFIFTTTGADTANINFYVRAIDNQRLPDPQPAYLKVPVKNTAPIVAFDTTSVPGKKINYDTVYSVFPLTWSVKDLDGNESIDSVYIKINDGDWYSMRKSSDFINIVPADPTREGSGEALVYVGSNPKLEDKKIQGLNVGGENIVYLKARDIAGAESKIDTTRSFYLTKKTSDLLVINGHGGIQTPTPESVYMPLLSEVYGAYDYLDLMRDGGKNRPRYWNSTFGLYLKLYDKVFWYGSAIRLAAPINQLLLELATNPLVGFLQANKKLFISTALPINLSADSPLYQFTPMDSIATTSGQARVLTDSLIYSVDKARYQDLKPSKAIIGATPFYAKADAKVIYKGQISKYSGWQGPDNFGALRTGASNNTNLVFISTELHLLGGNETNLKAFMNQVLNVEFAW